jgi:NADP-dependent 3-hydroxy acid dehydrogenase YdfG
MANAVDKVGSMTDTSPLTGTTALVTGASSGIGEATARHLAGLGADVALVARRRDRIEAVAKEIEAQGRRALVLEADVTDRGQAEGAVQRTVDTLGGLDILVNNAGVMLLGPIADAPVEEWEQMVHVNLLGLLYCAKAALPHLLEAARSSDRRTADLVNISSVAGRTVRLGSGVYNGTKHAVGAFSESLRIEVTKQHVRVGLIEPGAVSTELAGHNRPEVLEGIRRRFTEMERLEAHDIADAIGYMVTRPRHVAVNEILVRPTEQDQ